MKHLIFSITYWIIGVIILSLILLSTKYTFGQAFLTSCSILPGTLLAKYLGKDISFTNKRDGIINSIYLTMAVLITIYLSIILIHWYFLKINTENILMNPIFIFIIVSLYAGINYYLEIKLYKNSNNDEKIDTYITFISDRKKIKLELDSIKYIESNNIEVWIHTSILLPEGTYATYRTKMKISRWEEVLDRRFIRVHRSYIVNRKYINSITSTHVIMDNNIQIEISRKYKTIMQN